MGPAMVTREIWEILQTRLPSVNGRESGEAVFGRTALDGDLFLAHRALVIMLTGNQSEAIPIGPRLETNPY